MVGFRVALVLILTQKSAVPTISVLLDRLISAAYIDNGVSTYLFTCDLNGNRTGVSWKRGQLSRPD